MPSSVFSVSFVSSQMQAFTGWFAAQHPDIKDSLARAFPDSQLGHILASLTGAMWQAFGLTPQDVFYPAGTTDVSSVATRVISLKPKYSTTMNGSDSADAQLFNALAQAASRASCSPRPSRVPSRSTTSCRLRR